MKNALTMCAFYGQLAIKIKSRHMKKNIAILLTIALLIISCENNENETHYEFIDQDITGFVGGKSWEAAGGTCTEAVIDTSMYLVSLFQYVDPDNVCNTQSKVRKITFYISKSPSFYELIFTTVNSRSVTFYYYEDKQLFYNIAIKGAIEVLEVNQFTGKITGRIDAHSNENNTVNGNFEAEICD